MKDNEAIALIAGANALLRAGMDDYAIILDRLARTTIAKRTNARLGWDYRRRPLTWRDIATILDREPTPV